MIMNSGFSPNQKVFGRNVGGINNIEEINPAQLEGITESDKLSEIIKIQRRTKEEWIRLENDDRIKRALKGKIKMHKIEEAQLGARFFYERGKEDKWGRPGKVIGIDGKTVVIKHDSLLRNVNRVHITRIRKCREDELEEISDTEESEEVRENEEEKN